MLQVAHIVLLALSLLACPVNCLGSVDDGEAIAPSASAGCTCCHTSAAEPSVPPQSDQPVPDDDCACGNCLRHGAVLSDSVLWYDNLLDGMHFQQILAPSDAGAISPGLQVSVCPIDTLLPSATGRSVRILHQSFLI
jgi:hypothetical protein